MLTDIGMPTSSAARWRRRSGLCSWTLVDGLIRLGDVAVVAASGLLASRLRFAGVDRPDVVTVALLSGVLLAACLFSLLKVYDIERLAGPDHQLPHLLGIFAATIGVVLVVLYVAKSSADLSRLWVGYWLLAGCGGLAAWRLLVARAVGGAQVRSHLCRKVVFVGDGDLMAGCLARLGSGDKGSKVVGALVLSGECRPLPEGCVRIRALTELEVTVRGLRAHQVVLTVPLGRTNEIAALLRWLRHLPIEVSLYPDVLGAGLPVSGLTRIGSTVLLQLARRPLDGWAYLAKSLEDRLLALALLALMAPLLGAIAAAVKLTSPGPVFYRQLRYGFDGQPILIFKFRSMYVDHCDPADAVEVTQATRNDPRITPIGRFLRRTSLDELPQLLNVLRGEMSLVGPRPHALAHDDHYSCLIDGYLGRQRVRPGITGWAQVNGFRGETRTLNDMRRRVALDTEYIEHWSLLMDSYILLRTVLLFFRGWHPNAH